MEWKGIPHTLNNADDLDSISNSSSIIIDKISELTVNTPFSTETVITALLAAALPSLVAWMAIKSNKKDNKDNRDMTLNAAKLATYAQVVSESTRKNIDTVSTLTAHFMGYCTSLILAINRNTNDFDYSKNRSELVLISNKLKLLVGDDYILYTAKNYLSKSVNSLPIKNNTSILDQVELLLNMTEYYYCNLYRIPTKHYFSYEVDSALIELEIGALTGITKEYISFKENELRKELVGK